MAYTSVEEGEITATRLAQLPDDVEVDRVQFLQVRLRLHLFWLAACRRQLELQYIQPSMHSSHQDTCQGLSYTIISEGMSMMVTSCYAPHAQASLGLHALSQAVASEKLAFACQRALSGILPSPAAAMLGRCSNQDNALWLSASLH